MHFSRTPPWCEKCADCKRGSALSSGGAAILSTAAPWPNQTAVAHYCARPNPMGATISIVEDMGRGNADSGTVFVFPSGGSQWAEKAVELLDSAPAFADQMRLCDAALAEFVDWSLLEVVRGSVGSPSLDRVDVVQPVLFAAMVVAGRAMASAGHRARRRPRPFAGRDRCRLCSGRRLVARCREGRHVAKQGDRGNRRSRWHDLGRVAD